LQASEILVLLEQFVRRAFSELLLVSSGGHSHRRFAVVQRALGHQMLVHWIDFVRSASFDELDSRLQQMD